MDRWEHPGAAGAHLEPLHHSKEEEPDPGECSYKLPDREWVVPETAAGDARERSAGCVKGGNPQRLEEVSFSR